MVICNGVYSWNERVAQGQAGMSALSENWTSKIGCFLYYHLYVAMLYDYIYTEVRISLFLDHNCILYLCQWRKTVRQLRNGQYVIHQAHHQKSSAHF